VVKVAEEEKTLRQGNSRHDRDVQKQRNEDKICTHDA
jgi:hypothetical protein